MWTERRGEPRRASRGESVFQRLAEEGKPQRKKQLTERMDKAHVMSERKEAGTQQAGPMGGTLDRLLVPYLGPGSLIAGQ